MNIPIKTIHYFWQKKKKTFLTHKITIFSQFTFKKNWIKLGKNLAETHIFLKM